MCVCGERDARVCVCMYVCWWLCVCGVSEREE